MNKDNLKYIAKEKIRANPLNSFEVKDLDDLKNSIETYGLLDPLAVIGPFDDDTYVIIAGERRFCSICALNDKNPDFMRVIPCHIVGNKDMSELQQKLLIEVSNLETRAFNVNEHRAKVMYILKEMVESGELKDRNMATAASTYFKTSIRYGRYWRRVFNSDNEDVKNMVASDQLTIVHANDFINLDKQKQQAAMEQINQGENPNKVVEAFKKGPKRQTFSQDDLDNIDVDTINIEDFIDDNVSLDVDTTNRIGSLMREDKPSTKDYSSKLDTVRLWCEKMLEIDNPSDEEWIVIEACMDVADKFR